MPKSDELCPQGFAPHSIRPTRCKRCFRGYEEHKKKQKKDDDQESSTKRDNGGSGGGRRGDDLTSTAKSEGTMQALPIPEIVIPIDELPSHSNPPVEPSTSISPSTVFRRRRPETTKDDHGAGKRPSSDTTNLSATTRRTRARPCSWSGGTYSDKQQRPDGATVNNDSDDDDVDSSPSSPRMSGGARSRRVQIVSAKELRPSLVDENAEIPESASADVAFILRVKTSTAENLSKDRGSMHRSSGDDDDQDDSMSVAASTTTETTLSYHDSIEDMQATMQTLRHQVEELQQKCRRLETDRERPQLTAASEKENEALEKTAAELLRLKAQVFQLKSSNEELSDDNRVLRIETKELQDELTEVRRRAQQVEAKCDELANENSELKREMQDMEEEIDEMQDNFQDDQAGQFHDMRKNMEQLERNCRILQFKLRKAERRCEQLEADSNDADRLKSTLNDADDVLESEVRDKMQRLEAEVRASRQVSSRLHAETEVLRAKLSQIEDQPTSNGGSATNNETKVQSEGDDSGQLIRELYDTVEREKDLKEQLRFSEEEATSLRKKLTSFEEENDSLVMQIKKMVGNRPTSKTRRAADTGLMSSSQQQQQQQQVDQQNDQSIDESATESSAVEMNIQLELVEQESKVLRKKMSGMEIENERLAREVKELEQKIKKEAAASVIVAGPQGRAPSSANADGSNVPPTSDTVLHYQQTILIMETEAKELRRKLIDKQRENEQLHAELGNYKSVRRGSRAPSSMLASMRRSASLDSDNETTTLDLKRQLQLLEQEAGILRQRTLDLENDNDRLANENKRLEMTAGSKKQLPVESGLKTSTSTTTSTAKLKEQITKQEQEIAHLQQKLKEKTEVDVTGSKQVWKNLPSVGVGAYRQKTPKKITENCTRPELRKYVIDLEEEIKQLGVTLAKISGQVEVAAARANIETAGTRGNVDAECQTTEPTQELTANKELQTKPIQKDVEFNKTKLKKREIGGTSTVPKSKTIGHEVEVLKKKTETLEKEVADKTKKCAELSKQLEAGNLTESADRLQKMRTEADELRKEIQEHQKRAETQTTLKQELQDVKRELEDERAKLRTVNASRISDVEVKAKLADVQKKHKDLQKDIETKKNSFEGKLKELEDELKLTKEDVERNERDLAEANSQVKTETKRRERSERDYEAELRERDDDLNRLRDKNRKSEAEIEKLSANKGDLKSLERDLTLAKSEHDDLTTRYEALEEDYVIIKAQLVESETQYSEGQLVKNLRETFNLRQDTWIKEKLDMQEKLKELLCKLSRANTATWDLEKDLKNAIEEKIIITERMNKSELALKDEVERLRRQVEDTKKTLEDYEKIKGYGETANIAGDGATAKEVQDLKNKLRQEERTHRSEVSSTKLRYDQHLTAYQNEIQALHLQNAKFRRERDTYGLMMKGAQEKIADLKSDTVLLDNSTAEQMEEMRTNMERLTQEKEDASDKLDLAEQNCSRFKTEFTVEKASWEIRIAELQTKINELEEANVLQGAGKSRIVGVKSRLELAWQKERDEQRRLLADAKRQLEELRNHMGNDQAHTQSKIHELQEDLLQLRDAHSKMRSFNDRVRRDKDRMERERDELRTFLSRTQQLSVHERKSVMDLAEEVQKIKLMAPSVLGETLPKTTSSSSRHALNRVQQDEDIRDKFKSSLKRISSATEELRRVHGAKEEDRIRRNLSYRKALSEDEDRSGIHVPSTIDAALSRDDPLSRWQNPQRVTNYPASPPSMYISPQRSHGQHLLFRKSLSLDQSFGVGDHRTALWRSSVEGGDTSDGSSASLMSGAAPTPSPRLKKHLRRARQLGGSSLDGSDVSATTSMSSRETSAEPTSQRASDVDSEIANVKKKRGVTGMKRSLLRRLTKSKSVEETPTADHIKQVGVQVLSPGLGSSSSVSEAAPVATVRETKMGKDLKSRIANLFKKSSRSNSIDMGSSEGGVGARTSTLTHGKDNNLGATNTPLHKRYGSTSAL